MVDVISDKKWILLGFGLVNLVFLFIPIATGEIHNYYVLSLSGTWGDFLFLALIYFLLLVPFNALFPRFYSSDYYNKAIKFMNIVIPILGLISLLLYRTQSNMSSIESFTWAYYALFPLIILEHGYNLYLTYKNLF